MAGYDTSIRVNTKVDNSDLAKLQKDFDKLQSKLDSLYAKGEKLEALGVDKQSRQWKSLRYDVAQTEIALEDVKDRIKEVNQLNTTGANSGFKKIEQSSKKCLNTVQNGTKKSNRLLAVFASRLRGIALSLLVFNWITKGFNAMVRSMREGFHNLAQYSDEYNASMSALKSQTEQLKNSLATAFEPIVNMAIPYITKLVGWLNTAADAMAQFLAALQGKSTYTKAKKQVIDYAKSLDTASKSAKGALASFDKLNVLNKDNGSVSSGGGALTGADAFETAEISKEYTNLIKSVKEETAGLKDILIQGFEEGFGDATDRMNSLKKSISSIKNSFSTIFNHDLADGFASAIERMTKSLGVLSGATASVGITLGTNVLGGFAEYLKSNEKQIQQYLLSVFDISAGFSEKGAEFSKAFAHIFEPLANEDGQQITADIISIFSDAFMTATELLGEFALDIESLLVDPFVNSQDEIKSAYEDILAGLAQFTSSARQVFNDFFAMVSQFYSNYIAPVFEQLMPDMEALWQDHIAPLLSKFGDFFGELGGNVSELWNKTFKPFIQWLTKNILPVISPILQSVGKVFINVFGTIADVIGDILDVLGGVIDFITGIFTLNWEKAWNGIVSVFKSIINGIVDVAELVINTVIDIINGLIGGINAITDNVGIPKIPAIPALNIPKLANGAVIQGGSPFVAILGDQPAGQTNIETPLATMVDAFKQAMSETGSSVGGNYTFVAQLDGRTIFKETVRQDQMHQKATGHSAFAY